MALSRVFYFSIQRGLLLVRLSLRYILYFIFMVYFIYLDFQLYFPERASGGPLADEYNRARHCARLN